MYTGTCYRLTNLVTGQSYVGSSVSFEQRKRTHVQSLKSGRHHSPKLQAAWDQYGAKKFEWEILETIDSNSMYIDYFRELLFSRENYFIRIYDAVDDGYNICLVAGSPLGLKRSAQFSERMSQIKQRWHDENPEVAKQHSEDLIAYWSDFSKRLEQSERKKQFFIDNPNAAAEHGQRMQEFYASRPEAREEMRKLKMAYHEANPQAAEEARERATKQFSDPTARQAASEKATAFYDSPAEISKRKDRNADIRERLLNGETVREIVAALNTSAKIVMEVRKPLLTEGLLSNKVSDKTRERMSKPKSEEHRQNISLGQKGHEVSDDTRELIRLSSIKQFSDPAAREAAAAKTIAFYNSPEQVAKREMRDRPIREMLQNGSSDNEIIKALHVSWATVNKVKNTMKVSSTA